MRSSKRPAHPEVPFNSPVYKRIEEDLRARIRDGQWPAGVLLPSRKNLAEEYGVDLTTLQRAIAGLLADGTLRAEVPRGTFVAETSATEIEKKNKAKWHEGAVVEARTAPIEARGSTDAVRSASLGLRQHTRLNATLGVVAYIERHATNWDIAILRALERTFLEAGGAVTCFSLNDHNPPLTPAEAVHRMLNQSVDALAFISVYDRPGAYENFMSALDGDRIPALIVSWENLQQPVPHIFYDNHYAGYEAAEHLIRCGYGPLYFLSPYEAPWAEERIAGAGHAAECVMPPGTLFQPLRGNIPSESAYASCPSGNELAKKIFADPLAAKSERPPGIIASNDEIAAEVLRAAAEIGRKAGWDYGLIGFNDDPVSSALGLSTMRPPLESLGIEAGRALIRLLQGEAIPVQSRLRSHLISRASTSRRKI